MKPSLGIILWFVLVITSGIKGQIAQESITGSFTPIYFDTPDNSIPYELEEYFREVQKHPININAATQNELQIIPFLTTGQIDKIIRYRNQNQHFFSTRELYNVPGIDSSIISTMLPFLCVQKQTSGVTRLKKMPESYLDRAAYDVSFRILQGVTGDSVVKKNAFYSMKLHAEIAPDYQFGFAWNSSSKTKVKELLSFYLNLQSIPWCERMIIGDYRVSFGGGLLLGRYFPPGRTFNSALDLNDGASLQTNSNLSSAKMLRGIAALIPLTPVTSFTSFVSRRTVRPDTSSAGVRINSQKFTTYDDLSMSVDGGTDETTAGFILNTHLSRNISFCALIGTQHFDEPLKFGTHSLQSLMLYSINSSIISENYSFSGEMAYIDEKVPYRMSLRFIPNKLFSIMYAKRNFPSASETSLSQRGGQTGNGEFETGNLLAVHAEASQIILNAYYDQYSFSNASAKQSVLTGSEYYVKAERRFAGYVTAKLFTGVTNKDKPVMVNSILRILREEAHFVGGRITISATKQIACSLSPLYKYSKIAETGGSRGFGQVFGIALSPNSEIQIHAAFTSCQTDDYSSALSFFEPDLPGMISFNSLSGDGSKIAVSVVWHPDNKVMIGGKIAIQRRNGAFDRETDQFELRIDYVF